MIKIQEIEAIIQHRRMWTRISQLIREGREYTVVVPYKEIALRELGIETKDLPRNLCWCCEVSESDNCESCLVVWENNPNSKCTSNTGEYYKFICALRSKNWERAEELALQIANLPERFR